MRALWRVFAFTCSVVCGAQVFAAEEVTLLESEFVRDTGKPVLTLQEFEAIPGTATLTLLDFGVSSAVVRLNGAVVFGPKDFAPQVDELAATIEVDGLNQLAVELRGKPDRSLTIRITQVQESEPTIYYMTYDGQQLRRLLSDSSDQFVAAAPYGRCGSPTLSAAGTELLLRCGTNGWDTALWVVDADGAGSYQLAAAAWSQHSSWHDGDTVVAFDINATGIHRISASGGSSSLWIPVSQFYPFGKNSFRGPGIRWSADHTRFAANVGVASAGGNMIFVGNIDFATGALSNIRHVSPAVGSSWTAAAGGVDMSADGEWVYYCWRDLSTSWQDVRRVRFDGTDEQVLWGRTVPGDTGVGGVKLSPDGERLWFQPCVVGSCAIASIAIDGSDYQEVTTAETPGSFDLVQ